MKKFKRKVPYIVGCDTETTGLLEPMKTSLIFQPHMIEYACLMFETLTDDYIGEIESLIRPPVEIPFYISKINKIENYMVKDKKPFSKHADLLKNVIEGAELFVAQNAMFDKGMLDVEFARLGIQIKWPKIYCTIENSKHFRGRRLKNDELLLETTGKPGKGLHRAMEDIKETMQAYFALKGAKR